MKALKYFVKGLLISLAVIFLINVSVYYGRANMRTAIDAITLPQPRYCDYMAATTHAFATLRDNDGFSTNHFIFAFDEIIIESNNLLDREDLKFVAGLVDSVDLPPDTLADTVYETCLKELKQ